MSEILLCTSQEEKHIGYTFMTTKKTVYSLEEALFHCYHYFLDSWDFCSDEFYDWLLAMDLPLYAKLVMEIRKKESFASRLTEFLTIIDYFDDNEIDEVRLKITKWESRLEWERLKERADSFFKAGHYGEAISQYKKALSFNENAVIFNNIGVSYMYLKQYKKAEGYFLRSELFITREKDYTHSSEYPQILVHAAENLIYCKDYDEAQRKLLIAEELLFKLHEDISVTTYLNGILNMERGNFETALLYFDNAKGYSESAYKKAQCLVKLRQFDKALETLESFDKSGVEYLLVQAEIYMHCNNVPAAIKSIEKALMQNTSLSSLWVQLAKYYRLDYNLNMASSAITKALSLEPLSFSALTEQAKIKKAQGKIREYQLILNNILKELKKSSRSYL